MHVLNVFFPRDRRASGSMEESKRSNEGQLPDAFAGGSEDDFATSPTRRMSPPLSNTFTSIGEVVAVLSTWRVL